MRNQEVTDNIQIVTKMMVEMMHTKTEMVISTEIIEITQEDNMVIDAL
jgi:hypothetical protein